MNQKTKTIGLFTILSLFVIAVAPDYLGAADATKAEGSPGTPSPKSYGSATSDVVCGDRLCDESISADTMTAKTVKVTYEDMPAYMPTIRTVQVSNFSGESDFTFNAIYEITAGDRNLENIMVHVTSDMDSMNLTISGLFALDDSTNIIRINAMDPMTITAKIVGFQLSD